jgi:hypothetical protein
MDLGRHTANVAPEEATDNPWPDDGGIPTREEWSERRAFFMAMRVQIPLLGMIAENDWEPSSRGILVGYWPHTGKPMELWLTYEEFASSMMVANFIILPLIIAGATGYLKK